jgi:crotonobetainyl-CoA:carnitine CoA-transferase CaiB-like acyl-CoA transferase
MSQEPALMGVRISGFSQVLTSPFANQTLAQLGAQVIKIEQPVGV